MMPRGHTVPEDRSLRTARRILGTVTAGCVIGAGFLLPPAASAAPSPTGSFTSCKVGAVSQPFLPWFDPFSYELAPGGDFENADYLLSPWTLKGGAQRVPGSEPYAATGQLGSYSLAVPAGASAQSRPVCVSVAQPTIRFFVGGTGAVAVSVVYGSLAIPVGIVAAAGTWAPTPPLLTGSGLVGLLAGKSVSIRMTGVAGTPLVDDVFIDPWRRG